MTSPLATNAVPSINRALEADREGRPLQGQVPKTYQVYEGTGNDMVPMEGLDFFVIQSDLSAGPLMINTTNNVNLYGRTCNILAPQGCLNNLIFNYGAGNIYVAGSALPSNNYTVIGPFAPSTVTIHFYAPNECTLSVDNGGAVLPTVDNIYNADGELVADRIVEGTGNDLTFNGIGAFEIDSSNIVLNTTTGTAGLLVDDGTGSITATESPTVNDLTVTGTFNASVSEADISPGSNGQVLETVGGAATWQNKSVEVSEITSSGSSGVLIDDGVNVSVDNDPSVNSLTAAAGISGATLSGTLSESDIAPGSNGQVLETIFGTTAWMDKSIAINEIDSTGISGVLVDNGTNVQVTSGPTVVSLTATGNVSGSTLSGTLTESDVSPGSNGEVLTTVGGVSTWAPVASGASIYNSDGTLTGNRSVDCDSNNLSFDGCSDFSVDASAINLVQTPSDNGSAVKFLMRNPISTEIEEKDESDISITATQISSSGSSGVLVDNGVGVAVDNTPTVASLTATGNVGGATLSGTLSESDVSPGSNGEVLTTVGGVSAWASPSSGGFASEIRTGNSSIVSSKKVVYFGTTPFLSSPDITYNVGPHSYTPTVGQLYVVTLRFRLHCSIVGTAPEISINNYYGSTFIAGSEVKPGSVGIREYYEMSFPINGDYPFVIMFDPDGGNYTVYPDFIEIRRVQ